ncbi:hypothetical protein DFH09DRAFT_1218926 [Mycena vulgaris]|nr:hypothetical protein DFH09DRAFT_1218926 [Mycena vulgaris]
MASIHQAPLSIPRSKMVQLMTNVTAAATAATLFRILDFQQQNGLDLASSQCNDFTPVQSFTISSGVANQHWTLALVPGSANPGLTQIISSACNTYLSYPGQGTPSLALRSQATSRSSLFSSWHLIAVGSTGAFNIVEFSSGTYLTAWDQDVDPAVMSSGSPLTLERENPNDTRQQFWFVPGAHRT